MEALFAPSNMNAYDVIALIEDTAPLGGAAAWDRSGVQIAGLKHAVRKLAVLLDPVPDGIAEALDWGADMILNHHPLYIEPRALDKPGDFLEVVRMVLAHGAWLYAAHTSLDAQPE
ncbi:MAG: Nif3-like dinuclear metal center hexameric protein, partial [Thermodesulfobacteriota bacterium]|nr:Nif3-like dinuclear metal center hexameric protein [Thermodesulfobacteriota bacterium]